MLQVSRKHARLQTKVPILPLEVVATVSNWLGIETSTVSNASVRVDQDWQEDMQEIQTIWPVTMSESDI